MNLLLNDKTLLGNYLSRIFPLLLAVFIISFSRSKFSILLLLILFIITDVLIFLTGERTAFGLMALSSVFIIILIDKYKKIRFLALIVSSILIIVIATFYPDIKRVNIDRTINQMSEIIVYENEIGKEIKSKVIFSKIHHAHLMSAKKMFYNNPIFGQGPNMFRKLCDKDKFNFNKISCSTHPHNYYFQILAELGIVGLIFVLIIIVYFTKKIFLHFQALFKSNEVYFSDYQICIIACFFITLWPLIPTLNFFNNWNNIVIYFPLGFYLHSVYEVKSKNI